METLVAIGILTLSITVTLGLVANGLSDAIFAREEVTAFYLAQDAMEQIKNIRTENALHKSADGPNNQSQLQWLTHIPPADSTPYYIDSSGTFISCAEAPTNNDPTLFDSSITKQELECPLLNIDSGPDTTNTGLYGYNPAWTPTGFMRTVTILPINGHGDNEVQVQVDIYYSKGNIHRAFRLKENIFDWVI